MNEMEMKEKAKAILCKQCRMIVGYTHKDNNVPTIYCPTCVMRV